MAVEYRPTQEDLTNIQHLIGGLDHFVEPPPSLHSTLVSSEQTTSSGANQDAQAFGVSQSEESSDISEGSLQQGDTITRRDILDFGDEGFLLEGVLSKEECQFYINQGEEKGFGNIPDVKQTYRDSQRILFECEKLAHGLWERVQQFLTPITIDGDPHEKHIHGIKPMLQGTWMPLGLNPIFRLCRYKPGGHFAPHYDGHLVSSTTCRSLQTFMLYLNGSPDFQQGSTNFVDDDQLLYTDETGRYCAEEKNILCRLEPQPGLAIIFNHHRLHEGQAVQDGVKYILRTDIMFTKSGDSPSIDPMEEEALQLAQQAERLEALGQCMEAMKLYRKAFKMSPSLEQSYGS